MDKRFIQSDENGEYMILKINNKDALMNMMNGKHWFRHPAYYQWLDICGGDDNRGDEFDNKIEYYERILTPRYSITNIDYDKQIDRKRQISFYKLRVNGGSFDRADIRIKEFGECFGIIDIKHMERCINKTLPSLEVEMGECNYDQQSGTGGSSFKRSKYRYQNEYRVTLFSDDYKKQVFDNTQYKQLCEEEDLLICNFNTNKTDKSLINKIKLTELVKICMQKDYVDKRDCFYDCMYHKLFSTDYLCNDDFSLDMWKPIDLK